jgi:N-acetylglucosaminyldiphosphoundecaprenol N-acetyl-beta-D-mannosaminyltransferase
MVNYIKIFDTIYANVTREVACDLIENLIKEETRFKYVAVKDTDLIIRCKENNHLDNFYKTVPKYIFVCGRGIFYFSYLLGKPLKEMVGGPGIYYEMLKRAERNQYRIFYLGSSESILSKALQNIKKRYTKLLVVGSHNGYFTEQEEKNIIKKINDSNCDILFLGISTPKREDFIERNYSFFNRMICIPVGGVFDIESGEKKLAPKVISYLALEWFYRFIQEPKRLFKRYFYSHTKIFYYFLKEILH